MVGDGAATIYSRSEAQKHSKLDLLARPKSRPLQLFLHSWKNQSREQQLSTWANQQLSKFESLKQAISDLSTLEQTAAHNLDQVFNRHRSRSHTPDTTNATLNTDRHTERASHLDPLSRQNLQTN